MMPVEPILAIVLLASPLPVDLVDNAAPISCLSADEMRDAVSEGRVIEPVQASRRARNAAPGEVVRIRLCRQGEDFVKSMVARCKSGRDLVIDRLAQMNRVSVIPNQASFYLMLQVADMTEPLDFCKKLVVEGRVGLAPGTAFGKGGDSFLRLCYAQSEARLSEAMDRFSTFLAKY